MREGLNYIHSKDLTDERTTDKFINHHCDNAKFTQRPISLKVHSD